MSWIEIPCKSPRCRTAFKVDEELSKRRCHACGTVHFAPWEEHDPRLQPPEDNHPPELICEGCFTEFDVRREPSCEYQTNTFRCPNCGRDHSEKDYDAEPETPEVAPQVTDADADLEPEPVATDGGAQPAEMVEGLQEALGGGTGGELHVHFHTDG
jgi:hypothetical protein